MLDYQTQQYKILPLIATAYAMTATGQQTMTTYYELLGEVLEGNTEVLAEVRSFLYLLCIMKDSLAG